MTANEPELRRFLSLPMITLYGVGTMVGGGFYALLGEVAARAGSAAPLAFLASSVVALFSALSFAELTSRFPVSAGEAQYVRAAFGNRLFSVFIGGLVILTGIVSAATLSRAIAGFLFDLVGLPIDPSVFVVVLLLALVAAWGMGKSAAVVVTITVIEVGGLLLVLAVRGEHLLELQGRWREVFLPDEAGLSGLFLGTFLSFYAFIGFEDMVNVAEEVKDPERNLPRGILLALAITTLLYLVVATTAVLAVPVEELAGSHTPLALIVAAKSEPSRIALGAISILAGVNGALVQIIMASRIVYGLSKRSRSNGWLSHVNPRTRTPVRATVLIAILVVTLAFWFPLVHLATATSSILLAVFCVVNLALVVIKRRDPRVTAGPSFPIWIPMIGSLTCAAFLVLRLVG